MRGIDHKVIVDISQQQKFEMIGKFLVFAFVCVSLAQVRGDGLEEEKKQALARLKGMAIGAEKQIDGTIREAASKRDIVLLKSRVFSDKETRVENQMKQNVMNVADEMERKARETNKPPSCLDCIKKAEKETIKKLEVLGTKYQTDLKKLEKTSLDTIQVSSKPLPALKKSIMEKFQKAEAEIKNCKDVACVRKIMEHARKGCELLSAELDRISSQVETAMTQFVKDASSMFGSFSSQANRTTGEGIRAIKACVFGKSFFPQI